jgi:hypothetical protein
MLENLRTIQDQIFKKHKRKGDITPHHSHHKVISLTPAIHHTVVSVTMVYLFSSFRSTEGTKSRRQNYKKEKGWSSEPLLDTKVWSVSFTFPSDISASVATATSRSSIETSLISYDDYPSYPAFETSADDLPLEVDGVMAMNKSARSGASLRRRVSGSLRSLKKGVKRMAKKKHKDKISTSETSDQDDESISTNEWIESDAKRRKISVITRLRKKMLGWAKSMRKNASRSLRLDPSDDAVVAELGLMGTRPKASRKFSPLECNSVSYDVDVML